MYVCIVVVCGGNASLEVFKGLNIGTLLPTYYLVPSYNLVA